MDPCIRGLTGGAEEDCPGGCLIWSNDLGSSVSFRYKMQNSAGVISLSGDVQMCVMIFSVSDI